MATQVKQYPRSADGNPLDLEVAVFTDDTGNNGARLTTPITGPDGAPIDAKAVIPVDPQGNLLPMPILGAIMAITLFSAGNTISVPLGTTMVNTSGYSVANDGGHAIYVFDAAVDVAYVAANPRTSFRTVNNRGFRLSEYNKFNILMFGGKGDCVGLGDTAIGTDNFPAFVAAFAFLGTYASTVAYSNPLGYRGAASLWVPRGRYRCTGTLEPLYSGQLYGDGGKTWGAATQIVFPRGVTALRAQAANTSGAGNLDGAIHFAGDQLFVSDIAFLGHYANADMQVADEGEFHGFHGKRAHSLTNCTFDGFQGDGYYTRSTAGAGAPDEGNVNVSRVHNCDFNYNRAGQNISGNDANASAFTDCSFISNRRAGTYDLSFLGNHNSKHHYDSNARSLFCTGAAGRPCSYVTQGGNQYAVIHGQEVGASTNAPTGAATSNTWWIYWKAGGVETGIPAWFNGISVRSGGPVIANNINSACTFVGCHVEVNGASQIDQSMLWLGNAGYLFRVTTGAYSANHVNNLSTDSTGMILGGSTSVKGDLSVYGGSSSVVARIASDGLHMNSVIWVAPDVGAIIEVGRIGNGINARIRPDSTAPGLEITGPNNSAVLVITNGVATISGTITATNLSGTNTGDQFTSVASGSVVARSAGGAGPASALTTLPTAAMPALIGDITSTIGTVGTTLGANVVTFSKFQQVAANSLVGNPTGSLANAQGITLAGGLAFSGTTLTAAGALTPTSVASSGAITSTGGVIGYATGAGGTVAQATSKATTVILNKLSGEITLNAANLAADTTVSFTFTNSFLNANSIITFNHASVGTFGAYGFNAHGFGAGTCTVDVRNVTPGALAEAPVLRYAIGQAPTA